MLQPKQFNFEYSEEDYGESSPMHQIFARHGDTVAGTLRWDRREIREMDVEPSFRRMGVATSLWNEGHRLASENRRIPKPKHSADRTDAGDAWARTVGGRLPRRTDFRSDI